MSNGVCPPSCALVKVMYVFLHLFVKHVCAWGIYRSKNGKKKGFKLHTCHISKSLIATPIWIQSLFVNQCPGRYLRVSTSFPSLVKWNSFSDHHVFILLRSLQVQYFYTSIYLSVCLSIYLTFYPSTCLPACLSVCLSQSPHPSIHPSISIYIHRSFVFTSSI